MNKVIWAILYLLWAPPLLAVDPPAVFWPSQDPRIVSLDVGCTGAIVQKGVVITAGHCIEGPLTPLHLYNGHKKEFKTAFSILDPTVGLDFAVLVGDTEAVSPFKVYSGPMPAHLPCTHIGLGGDMKTQKTYPLMYVGVEHGEWGIKQVFSGFAQPGDSGGPILDVYGRVVGVVNHYTPFGRRVFPEMRGTPMLFIEPILKGLNAPTKR